MTVMTRTIRRLAAVGAAGPLLTLTSAAPASAHERWFAELADGGDWGFFLSPVPLTLTAAVVAVTVLWRLAARRLPRPELSALRPLGRLAPYVPRLLGIHLGVSLLAFSVTGAFLTPSLALDHVPGGDLAGVVQASVGIWLVTGIRLRAAAAGVVLLGPAALLAAGPVALLENAALLGIALFLAVLPPSDGTFGRVHAEPERLRLALLGLRALVATSLVTLAFSEKFTNPELARNTLAEYPQLDVLALAGLHVPTDVFIAVAGAVELLFGLLVLSGALPQVAVLVAAVPFNATLLLFGTTEVIGHLPVYGVFLALLVYGSQRATAPQVSWLPTVRQSLTAVHRVVTYGRSTAPAAG
jgi:uncharacterized membrane protein YphA (DoxX/SURF4 family)